MGPPRPQAFLTRLRAVGGLLAGEPEQWLLQSVAAATQWLGNACCGHCCCIFIHEQKFSNALNQPELVAIAVVANCIAKTAKGSAAKDVAKGKHRATCRRCKWSATVPRRLPPDFTCVVCEAAAGAGPSTQS